MDHVGHVIDNERVEGPEDRRSPIYNPSTGEVQRTVGLASPAMVNRAIESSAAAAAVWGTTSLSRRAEVLFRFRQLIADNADTLAEAVSLEHGKTLPDAAGEVARGLENVEFATGLMHLLKGGHAGEVAGGVDVRSERYPLGVVAGITPFNFPAMVPLWMAANAIACGNAFLLKPSEKDPSASVLLADLAREAGLPPGVLNVLHGDAEVVGMLLDDPRCMAVSVVAAAFNKNDGLVAAIAERMGRLVVGPSLEPTSEMGPLVTGEHRDKVASYLDAAVADGATLIVDGRQHEVPSSGFFLGPSLVDHVRPGTPVYDDEIFGPVLSVVRVETFDEAVALVNANPYGNGVAIFTRDGGAARRFERSVQVGMVGFNVPIPVPVASFSFGGWKDSLFGDTHIYGPSGLDFYTRWKVTTQRWPDPGTSSVDLGFPRTR